MFEGIKFFLPKNNVQQIKNCTIIHTCKRCKKKIHTFWEEDQVQGSFLALEAEISEVLETPVADPKEIICFECHYGF